MNRAIAYLSSLMFDREIVCAQNHGYYIILGTLFHFHALVMLLGVSRCVFRIKVPRSMRESQVTTYTKKLRRYFWPVQLLVSSISLCI
jgi:hypothetical protein